MLIRKRPLPGRFVSTMGDLKGGKRGGVGLLCPDVGHVLKEEGMGAFDDGAFVHDVGDDHVTRLVELGQDGGLRSVARGIAAIEVRVHVLRRTDEGVLFVAGRQSFEVGQVGLVSATRCLCVEDEDLVRSWRLAQHHPFQNSQRWDV